MSTSPSDQTKLSAEEQQKLLELSIKKKRDEIEENIIKDLREGLKGIDSFIEKQNQEVYEHSQEKVHPESAIPNEKTLKEWFGHIKKLHVEIFIIESKVERKCEFCEAWKADQFERDWFQKLHYLTGLSEDIVSVEEIKCDWNLLWATTYMENGEELSYPDGFTEEGDNYCYAFGLDIEQFPAIRINMISTKSLVESDAPIKKKSDKSNDDEVEIDEIFQALGEDTQIKRQYAFGGEVYTFTQTEYQVKILAPLMRFLRTLDAEKSKFPVRDDLEITLGQYHRHLSKTDLES